MTRRRFTAALGGLLAGALAGAPAVYAHATYNLSGYGAGFAGSVGSDGQPADPAATWTNGGVADYAGGLPVMWYAGMHSPAQVRTIQTGSGPNPPNGSLLQQVNGYNTANDPDLPTDRVLAVGGKSWSDPSNGNQGWGHGLDYGLVHFEPVADVLAGGPVKFTITVEDDPSDGVSPQLAFAIYGGWDTNPSSVRHQTFVTSPTPVSNPLGSTGLTLLDFAVATGAGRTLSRTYDLDATYDGKYTVFVAALGGVTGQYQLTVSTAPDAGLADCQSDLAAATIDSDADGVGDASDGCADTPAATAVDQLGCSRVQFCGGFDVAERAGQKACKKADWGNDEPAMTKKQSDCRYDKATDTCVPGDIP
jgi:hypothetical protein